MATDRQKVELILYGSGTARRFTVDNPVLPDLWAAYLAKPDSAQHLLIEPWLNCTSFEVAAELERRMPDDVEEIRRPASNRTLVVATLTLGQLVEYLIPITGWCVDISNAAKEPNGKKKPPYRTLPSVERLWDDVIPAAAHEAYAYPKILSFVRIAGFIMLSRSMVGEDTADLESWVNDIGKPGATADDTREVRDKLGAAILDAYREAFGARLPEAADRAFVFKINKNRPATLAIVDSVRTVKADAANTVFSVKCNKLVWAVVDSGIDARHPAFLDHSVDPEKKKTPLQQSRVTQTYDFTYFRELLLGEEKALPERLQRLSKSKSLKPIQKRALETMERIRNRLPVEWEDLRPLITVPHEEEDVYAAEAPTNGHGTHVAGILGADWRKADGSVRMKGVCPDINLIDVRVCRPDGTSDEFIIISALQFLRYLNANSDVLAVHGVNLSLSLVADVASYACGQTPVCLEAERNVASGMVTVVAAGNLGFRRFRGEAEDELLEQYFGASITDPGNAEAVITVGSTHRREPHSYGVSYFSSRGPTGDGRIKPDIVAPGEKINAPTIGDSAMVLDGTSMAAPHVSGAAAMLMARHPELVGRPQRVKSVLCNTATDLGRERYFQGHGLLDVLRAIQSV